MQNTFKAPGLSRNNHGSRRTIALLVVGSLLAFVTVGIAGIPQPDAIFYGSVTINGQPITASDDVSVVGRVAGLPEPVGRYRMGDGLSILALSANCDADGVIGLADHQVFKNCVTAPGQPAEPNCACADVDGDGDVDLRDWKGLQSGFGTAGDHYVLRVRLEAPVTGSPQSPNAARLGQGLLLYVKQENNPEILATSVSLTSLGILQRVDLSISVLLANCVADGVINLADHQAVSNCVTGPGGPATPGCSCADVDGDGDVDLRDWKWLQSGFSG